MDAVKTDEYADFGNITRPLSLPKKKYLLMKLKEFTIHLLLMFLKEEN